jgi:hypothetical protein
LTTSAGWLERPLEPQPDAAELIHRYLTSFGPATVQDIQAWSGLTRLGEVVEAQRRQLRSFEDEHGRELLDVPQAPLPEPDTPAPARFLPPFDNAILSHADRARIIARGDREVVNRDRLMRTFLIDGFVSGTWGLYGTVLQVQTFRPLPAADRRALADEGERLLALMLPDATVGDIRFL